MATFDKANTAAAAQGMYIDKQQYEAMEQKLYRAVECRLEESGVMSALKAQLRADIFAAMVEPSPNEQASTAERCRKLPRGNEALGLVVDYLASLGLTRVLCVLAPDVGLSDESVHPDKVLAPATRSKLRDDVGLPAVPSKIPLLCELLEHGAQPVPKLDPSMSLSSSMPMPASTTAKLEAARAAALLTVQQAEDSYSASASFEEASISPRASYGDASFESESPRASPRTLSPRVSPSPSPEPAALRPRPDDSDASIEDDVEVASASEDSMFGGGGLGGGVRGSEDSMFGGGGDADADAPARGGADRSDAAATALGASEDSMFGAAGAAPARGLAADSAADSADDGAEDGAARRADDQSESASASDSSGDVSFAEDSEGDAPAPARRPQTIDALFDSDGSEPEERPPPPPPPRRTFPPPAAPPRPPPASSAFPTLPGMVAAPAADDGDDPFPGLAPGPDEDDNVSSRTGASSRTGTTATTAAARHDDVF
jgi:hypothetical protein